MEGGLRLGLRSLWRISGSPGLKKEMSDGLGSRHRGEARGTAC